MIGGSCLVGYGSCVNGGAMIEVEGLTKRYGAIAAIEDVSFRVEQGEIVGFLGPNGAGKTTTMRILTGFSPASRGTARVAGYEVHAAPVEVKRRIGYMPETVPLYGDMVVGAFLSYVAEVKGVARSARRSEVGRVTERCGVTAVSKRLIRHLSKGFRQRVGLAQALIANPPVLILDEPTAGLDPRQIVEIRRMIQDLAREHTVLLSTHILPEVSMVCQRVVIIHRGRIAMQDSMANLAGRVTEAESRTAGFPVVFELHAEGPGARVEEALRSVAGVEAVREERPGHYRIEGRAGVDFSPEVVRALTAAGVGIRWLRPRMRSLEDVFMEVVAQDAGSADAEHVGDL